jgi:hypothetical protein
MENVLFDVNGVTYPLSLDHATIAAESLVISYDHTGDYPEARPLAAAIELRLVGEDDTPVKVEGHGAMAALEHVLDVSMAVPPPPQDGIELMNALRRELGQPEYVR